MRTLNTARTVWRSLALVCTVGIIALSTWSLIILQVIDSRGFTVLSNLESRLGAATASWSQYITAAARGTAWAQVLVTIGSIMAVTILLVIMSNRYYWIRIPPAAVVTLDFASTICSTAVFGCAVTLALSLDTFNAPALPTFDSADLTFFAQLNPLSRAITIISALGGFFLITAFMTSLIDLQTRRAQARDTRAFEPTVSALGMSHGFHALHPERRTAREQIPTMYDPYRAFRQGQGASHSTEQLPFADEAAWISRKQTKSRWSASTTSPRGIERDIIKLLDVKKARRAVSVRPARPKSGAWDGRGAGHVI
ncbi:hypothetical protein C7974DRAFT_1621 [Boeremia exigua]|uniref:uncharacterized protein n=1 Tax=Boeremia exigua TaxID=749465 RepID=UPI001E8E0C6C|nr:uncharacterized protein C7974DRAFT_1621 [Boeremia exigua]KAH6643620.1 hypothetical protein C7974DRAFT_1621 [Boeremia exigua]